jgi:hypothetical protein
MVHNAAMRYELTGRYYSGVVSRLCIRSLHTVVTVLFFARLNTHWICSEKHKFLTYMPSIRVSSL